MGSLWVDCVCWVAYFKQIQYNTIQYCRYRVFRPLPLLSCTLCPESNKNYRWMPGFDDASTFRCVSTILTSWTPLFFSSLRPQFNIWVWQWTKKQGKCRGYFRRDIWDELVSRIPEHLNLNFDRSNMVFGQRVLAIMTSVSSENKH